jgi:hypothetical protein
MERYAFRLTDEHASWIDAEAKRRGVSQSEILRELIDQARTNQGDQTL